MPFVDGEFQWAPVKPKSPRIEETKADALALPAPEAVDFTLDVTLLLFEVDLTDFTLEVGDNSYKVHRNILAARSPVFRAMFECDFIERRTGCMKMVFEDHIVRALLKYIYGYADRSIGRGRPHMYADFLLADCMPRAPHPGPQNAQAIADLFQAADYFQLPELKTMCENNLVFRLINREFCEIVTIAHRMQIPRLMTHCVLMFCRNWHQIVQLDDYDDLDECVKNSLIKLRKSYSTSYSSWRDISESSRSDELVHAPNGAMDAIGCTNLTSVNHEKYNPLTFSSLSNIETQERVTEDNALIADVSFLWVIHDPSAFLQFTPSDTQISMAVANRELHLIKYGIRLRINCYINQQAWLDHILFGINYEEGESSSIDLRMSMGLVDGEKVVHKNWHDDFWTYQQSLSPTNNLDFYMDKCSVMHFVAQPVIIFKIQLEIILDENLLGLTDQNSSQDGLLKHDMFKMYESGLHADFKLTGGGKDFHVHRNILSIRSGIIRNANQATALTIPDISSDSTAKLMEFLYMGELTAMDDNNAKDLLKVAFEFDIPQLHMMCELKLVRVLSLANVCELIGLAQKCKAKDLEKMAVNFVGRNVNTLWGTDVGSEILLEFGKLSSDSTRSAVRL